VKIGLIDVDSHNFPNLALMKISTYHKELGDQVNWYDNLVGLIEEYDIVYMSKVFTDLYTPDYQYNIYAKEVIKGGYGYDNYELPFDDYETTYPDYSIYHDIYPQFRNTAFGYLTRGCPRNCSFCIVSGYEGIKTRQVANIDDFYDKSIHKEIRLLDPNILAHKDLSIFEQLQNADAWVHFTGGVDIRFLKKEHCDMINNMKIKMLHFAWDNDDNMKTENEILEKRKWIKYDRSKVMFYVLVNFDTKWEFDLYRVKKLKELDCDPYIMIYDKPTAPKKYKHLQRFVNNKFIFWSKSTVEDYLESKGVN
jgi:hypothetical protein